MEIFSGLPETVRRGSHFFVFNEILLTERYFRDAVAGKRHRLARVDDLHVRVRAVVMDFKLAAHDYVRSYQTTFSTIYAAYCCTWRRPSYICRRPVN